VLIASPSVIKSLYIQGELNLAKRYHPNRIYPVWIDGTDWSDCVPIDFINSEYIDMRKEKYGTGLNTLINALKRAEASSGQYTAPSPVIGLSSLASTNVTRAPVQPQQGNRRNSRLPIVVGFLVLVVVSFIIMGLVFSPILSLISGGSATPTTGVSSSPIVSLSTGVSPSPLVYPNIAGNYSGGIRNTLSNENSTMALMINQNQGSISGQFSVDLPLKGTGSFTGTIDTSKNIQFLVVSTDTIAPILFKGTVLPDGSLSGSYCSVQPNNQCDTTMGRGTWNATRQ
jgi:hypothetical protein